MGFWDWFEKPRIYKGSADKKRTLVFIIVFFIIPVITPVLIHFFTLINGNIWEGDSDGIPFYFWIIIGLYYSSMYWSHETYKAKKRMNTLINELIDLLLISKTDRLLNISKKLASFDEYKLFIGNLASITPEVAKELVKFASHAKHNLEFENLSIISSRVAAELSKFQGDGLFLDGIASLDPDVATELSKFRGNVLSLRGLSSIAPEVAKELAKFSGHQLNLPFAWEVPLSDDVVRELKKYSGDINYCSADKYIEGCGEKDIKKDK